MLSESYKKRIKELAGILNEVVLSIDDVYNKYYKKINRKDFNEIVAADPTSYSDNGIPKKMGNYSKWLLSLFMKHNLKLEDLYKATEYLTLFNKNKNLINKDNLNSDINKYKNLPQLFDVVKKYRTAYKPNVESVEDENELLTNDFFVQNGEAFRKDLGNWIVVIPKSLDASKFYGCTSEWCTLMPTNFEGYSKRGDLHIFINKQEINTNDIRRRVQIHIEDNQFMDMNDNEIDRESFFSQNPEIFNYLYYKYKDKIHHSDIKIEDGKIFLVTNGWQDFAENFSTGRDISQEFIEDVLQGESYNYFNYSSNDFEAKYYIDEINENNFNEIKKIMISIDNSIDLSEVKGMDDLFDIIEENDLFDDIKDAILISGVQCQESADADEAYKGLTKAIINHFNIKRTEWKGEKLYCEIPETSYKGVFFTEYNEIKDALANNNEDTLIDYSPPYNGYNGDIEKEYFNENLSERLSDLK